MVTENGVTFKVIKDTKEYKQANNNLVKKHNAFLNGRRFSLGYLLLTVNTRDIMQILPLIKTYMKLLPLQKNKI